jgi:uncharacterized alpha-E superfamily protein
MGNLLARSAGNLFWLARYLERVENMARIIEITETFTRDSGARNWLSVVQINADEKRFFEKHKFADGRASDPLDRDVGAGQCHAQQLACGLSRRSHRSRPDPALQAAP